MNHSVSGPGGLPPKRQHFIEGKSLGNKKPKRSDKDTIDKLFELVKGAKPFTPEEKDGKYAYLRSDSQKKIKSIRENLKEFQKTGKKENLEGLAAKIHTITDLGYMRIRKVIENDEKRKELFSIFTEPPPRPPLKRGKALLQIDRPPASKAKTQAAPKPSLIASEGRTSVQTEMLKQAQARAKFRRDEYRPMVLDKMGKIIKSENRATQVKALGTLKSFILDSNPTRNFDGSNMDKLKRLEKSQGWERPWDFPRETQQESYIRKRGEVERRMHGYADDPYIEEGFAANRPVYMGVNPGKNPRGAAPYFGGSYFVAKKEVYRKATFAPQDTFQDSFKEGGMLVTTVDSLDIVLAQMKVEDLKALYDMATDKKPHKPLADGKYIEVQIANMKWSDYEKIVLDRKEVPVGSKTEQRWEAMAAKHGFKLEFFDSKGWEEEISAGGLTKANEIQLPLSKADEKASSRKQPSDPTEQNIAQFMETFELVRDDEKKGNIGQDKLRDMGLMYADIVLPTNVETRKVTDEPKEEETISTGMLYRRLLLAAEPYAREYTKRIRKFFEANNNKFREYIKSLPGEEDVKETEQKRLEFEKEISRKNISKKEQKHLNNLIETERTTRENALLKKRIENVGSSFSDLGQVPVTLTGKWPIMIGDFKKALDKKDTDNMSTQAFGMYKEQETFCEKMNILTTVLKNRSFNKTDKNQAREIAKTVRVIAQSGEELKLLLQKVAWSVQADPEGWLRKTGNETKTDGAK